MILVDSATGSWELQAHIERQGIVCEKTSLPYADACFEGNGPDGVIGIGVERKRIGDILNCIDDGRFVGHQLVGMRKMYRLSWLVIEGYWKPDPRDGIMLFGTPKKDGSVWWTDRGPKGSRVMYHKLRRYLFSVALGGVHILYTRDIGHTAFDIVQLYHYFSKKWRDHKSLLEMHRGYFWQRDGGTDTLMVLPSLSGKPPLVRRWAAELGGIGVKMSEDAARVFRTPKALANADEMEWLNVPGVGPKTAQSIVREIGGYK